MLCGGGKAKLRPIICLDQALGVGVWYLVPKRRFGCKECHLVYAWAKRAVTLDGPDTRRWAALAMGGREGRAGVGQERKRKEVAKDQGLPVDQQEKGGWQGLWRSIRVLTSGLSWSWCHDQGISKPRWKGVLYGYRFHMFVDHRQGGAGVMATLIAM